MKTTDEIYAEMKSDWETSCGLSLSDGGDMALRLHAAAAQLECLWAQADFVLRQSFPQTAEGGYLDYHAALRALTRGAAKKATGVVRFRISEARATDLAIAAGVACMTAAQICFTTTAAGTIAAGATYCDVAAEADAAGVSGNVPAGSVVCLPHAPTGVEGCTNAAAFSGGAAAESDAELRERVLRSYKTLPNGANAAYYEAQALAVDGVAAVAVLPQTRGLGTVDVVISADGGAPSATLIAAVQAALDATRELCVDIEVYAPTLLTTNVAAAVECAEGYNYEDVGAAVTAAITAYFNGALLGRDVLRAKLGAVIWGVEGVANYSLTAPAADAATDADELPVLGTLTVTEMS